MQVMDFKALAATLVYGSLQIGTLLLFPAAAIHRWRSGGRRHLAFTAAFAIAVIIAAALLLASEAFGNRLSANHGYLPVATRLIIVFILTFGLPVLAVTSVMPLIPRQESSMKSYALALAAAVVAWAAGLLLSIHLRPLLP